jgi:hypothetical protein
MLFPFTLERWIMYGRVSIMGLISFLFILVDCMDPGLRRDDGGRFKALVIPVKVTSKDGGNA